MLKIAAAQTAAHKRLAEQFLALYRDGATAISLELLIRQSFQKHHLKWGNYRCSHRDIRFHLDRRAALYEWLYNQKEYGIKHSQFYVSVMAYRDSFLYSYQPSVDSKVVYRLKDMLSDLAWYHTNELVHDCHNRKGEAG